ncbi:glycosyltransferase [[Clostridium] symbiosum]|uniref:glycosyltransferase n=1 Tax=Clostridium symbiosum TaxID=1512 RepID=UPI001D0672EA|nr:glycosyltransferase [[Clostridium] symbiosum]MCB6607645.1 glycosyltransferase [[Clostridium] symbiosum]MCB6929322.1 glycosyltransferase [[Clostridium] symbiosum]
MNLLYITYIDFKFIASGSSVRPFKMYQAFKKIEDNVILLEGAIDFINQKKRLSNIKRVNQWLDNNQPDYCYVESPVYPLLIKEDILLLRRIYELNIPILYFVRDFRYLFKEEFFKVNDSFISYVKKVGLILLYKRDEHFINKVAAITYFPTDSCLKYFKYRDKRVLMPASERIEISQKKRISRTVIYVGGISEEYGFNRLLDAMRILNNSLTDTYKLIVVCRKEELEMPGINHAQLNNYKWLEIRHTTEDKLSSVYHIADVGVISMSNRDYTNLAMPIKTFEYLAYGLPIVATPCYEVKKLVEKHDIGIIAKDFNPVSLAYAVKGVLEDENLYYQYRRNISKFLENNYWTSRALHVREDAKKIIYDAKKN